MGKKIIFDKTLIGQKFNSLTIIDIDLQVGVRKRIICKCDCGREIIVPSQSLIRHHTVSCGCIISYYNMIIGNYLTELNILHTSEYTIKIDNTYFRFDFYLPTYNLMIEYDGEQHFMPVKYYNCSDDDAVKKFEKTKNSDQIKNKYCIDNGIELLRIPYYEKNNIKPIIDMCLQRLSEKASV